MNVGILFTVFGLILVAELPDKTMIATLIMGSRSRPLWVWLGACGAFTVHVTLAVAAGRLIELLPHHVVEIVVTVLFFIGAVVLLFIPEKDQEKAGEEEAEGRGGAGMWKVVGSAFAVVLVGEFGDLTQILTVNLAAKYHSPASVFVGALGGLVLAAAIGAFGGRALLRVLPLIWIRRAGGVALLGLGAYNLSTLIH